MPRRILGLLAICSLVATWWYVNSQPAATRAAHQIVARGLWLPEPGLRGIFVPHPAGHVDELEAPKALRVSFGGTAQELTFDQLSVDFGGITKVLFKATTESGILLSVPKGSQSGAFLRSPSSDEYLVEEGGGLWIVSPAKPPVKVTADVIGEHDRMQGSVEDHDHTLWATNPAWDPNGNQIAYFSTRAGVGEVWVVAPREGTEKPVAKADQLLGWAGSTDLLVLRGSGSASQVLKVSTSDGSETTIASGIHVYTTTPKGLIVYEYSTGHRVYLDFDGQSIMTLSLPEGWSLTYPLAVSPSGHRVASVVAGPSGARKVAVFDTSTTVGEPVLLDGPFGRRMWDGLAWADENLLSVFAAPQGASDDVETWLMDIGGGE